MITDFNDLRQRILSGQELSVEEYRAYLAARREGRQLAAVAAASKPKKGSKALSTEAAQKLLEDF